MPLVEAVLVASDWLVALAQRPRCLDRMNNNSADLIARIDEVFMAKDRGNWDEDAAGTLYDLLEEAKDVLAAQAQEIDRLKT